MIGVEERQELGFTASINKQIQKFNDKVELRLQQQSNLHEIDPSIKDSNQSAENQEQSDIFFNSKIAQKPLEDQKNTSKSQSTISEDITSTYKLEEDEYYKQIKKHIEPIYNFKGTKRIFVFGPKMLQQVFSFKKFLPEKAEITKISSTVIILKLSSQYSVDITDLKKLIQKIPQLQGRVFSSKAREGQLPAWARILRSDSLSQDVNQNSFLTELDHFAPLGAQDSVQDKHKLEQRKQTQNQPPRDLILEKFIQKIFSNRVFQFDQILREHMNLLSKQDFAHLIAILASNIFIKDQLQKLHQICFQNSIPQPVQPHEEKKVNQSCIANDSLQFVEPKERVIPDQEKSLKNSEESKNEQVILAQSKQQEDDKQQQINQI